MANTDRGERSSKDNGRLHPQTLLHRLHQEATEPDPQDDVRGQLTNQADQEEDG